MVRILLPFAAALAACTPSPQESAMRNSNPAPGTAASGSSKAASEGEDQAALGPIPEPASAAENALPARPVADSPAEARGRKILSTAYVMVGPDGLLTVQLRDGRVLVLRNAVLRPRDFCGTQVSGGKVGAQYCGGYAEVAAAQPGRAPSPQ